jgi:hypothetical protein
MNMLDLIIKFPFFPHEIFPALTQRREIKRPLGVLILSVFCFMLSRHIVSGHSSTVSVMAVRGMLLAIIAVAVVICFIALMHVLSELTGGKGDVVVLLSAACFSSIPLILFLPLSQIIACLHSAQNLIYAITGAILFLWVLSLLAQSMKYFYAMGMAHTIVIILAPLYMIPVFILICVAAVLTIIFSSIPLNLLAQFMH